MLTTVLLSLDQPVHFQAHVGGGARYSFFVPLPPRLLSCSFTILQVLSSQVLPPFRISPLAQSPGTLYLFHGLATDPSLFLIHSRRGLRSHSVLDVLGNGGQHMLLGLAICGFEIWV